jgi:hypothetical protein
MVGFSTVLPSHKNILLMEVVVDQVQLEALKTL